MALQLKLEISEKAMDNMSFKLLEKTGNYDTNTNQGGFGSPNPTKASFSKAIFQVGYYGSTDNKNGNIVLDGTTTPTTQLFLNGESVLVNSQKLGQANLVPFADGIHIVRYMLLEGGGYSTLTRYNNDPHILHGSFPTIQAMGFNPATFLVCTVGPTPTSPSSVVLMRKHETEGINDIGDGTGILYLSKSYPGLPEDDPLDGLSLIVHMAYFTDTLFTLDGIISGCLSKSIASMAVTSCGDTCQSDLVSNNMWIYEQKMAAEIKFNCGDYAGAQAIYAQLSKMCGAGITTKTPCGCT